MFGEQRISEFARLIHGVHMNKEKRWTKKNEGKCNPEYWKWIVGVVKAKLGEIAQEMRSKKVAMVIHGSFLRKIIGSAGAKGIELMSYSFESVDGVFKKLTDEEVDELRGKYEEREERGHW